MILPHKVLRRALSGLVIIVLLGGVVSSCAEPETEETNKAMRRANKKGIEKYEENEFAEASEHFDEAVKQAPEGSERASFNRALSTILALTSDTTGMSPEDVQRSITAGDSVQLTPKQKKLKAAREELFKLSREAKNADVAEIATYTLGNDFYWIGDNLMKLAERTAQSDPWMASTFEQAGIESFRQAVDTYKRILRQKPNDQQTLQNMYIAQLRIPDPPENNGGGGNDQEQQQQQQQQPQQSEALKALENREQQNRRKREVQPQPAANRKIQKPW